MSRLLIRAALLGAASAGAVWIGLRLIPSEENPFSTPGEDGKQVARAGLAGALFALVGGLI